MHYITLTGATGNKPTLIFIDKICDIAQGDTYCYVSMVNQGSFKVTESIEEITKMIDHAKRPLEVFPTDSKEPSEEELEKTLKEMFGVDEVVVVDLDTLDLEDEESYQDDNTVPQWMEVLEGTEKKNLDAFREYHSEHCREDGYELKGFPTGIGTKLEVTCKACETSHDITDYTTW